MTVVLISVVKKYDDNNLRDEDCRKNINLHDDNSRKKN